MNRRHHGAIPSDPHKLEGLKPARQHPMIGARIGTNLPTESNLLTSLGWTWVGDQGESEACTCFSFAVGIALALRGAGQPLPWIPSQHLLYSLSGDVEGGNLTDKGRQLADVVAAARQVGIGAMVMAQTPDGRNADIDADNVDVDVTPAQSAECIQHECDFGEHVIDLTEADWEDQVVATLTAQHPAPVWLAATVGSAFDALTSDGVAMPESDGGGHAMLIVGHKTFADGTREYLILNSWGTSWANAGTVWASPAFVRACWELRPLTAAPPSLLQRLAAELRAVV